MVQSITSVKNSEKTDTLDIILDYFLMFFIDEMMSSLMSL